MLKVELLFLFLFSGLGQKSADFGLIQHQSTGQMFGLVQGRTDVCHEHALINNK